MGSPASDLGARYETKTAVFLKENRLPGAAVGVVHGSELAYACGVGFADVRKRRSCDPQTGISPIWWTRFRHDGRRRQE